MLASPRAFRLAAAVLAFSLPCAAVEAQTTTWYAELNGPSESPPVASPGTGFGLFTYDPIARTFSYNVSFQNLLGTTTAAHIHCCTAVPFFGTAGVATTTPTFATFPLGVTSGVFVTTLDLSLASSWNATYITNNGGTTATAEAAFIAGINSGSAYFNIHTSQFPGGEIRGFLTVVPEPSTVMLTAAGILGIGIAARRRRRTA